MTEWIEIHKGSLSLPPEEELDNNNFHFIRMKRKPLEIKNKYFRYHNTYHSDGVYEGKIVWYHQIGYCLLCRSKEKEGETFYLSLLAFSHYEKEILLPITSRFEILDL